MFDGQADGHNGGVTVCQSAYAGDTNTVPLSRCVKTAALMSFVTPLWAMDSTRNEVLTENNIS